MKIVARTQKQLSSQDESTQISSATQLSGDWSGVLAALPALGLKDSEPSIRTQSPLPALRLKDSEPSIRTLSPLPALGLKDSEPSIRTQSPLPALRLKDSSKLVFLLDADVRVGQYELVVSIVSDVLVQWDDVDVLKPDVDSNA